MYIQDISIEIKSKANKDDVVEEFEVLMAHYRSSGQTQGRIESCYITNNTIHCLPYTLEKNSLSKKYNNYYVNKKAKTLEELCNSKLSFKTVGKSYHSYKGPCTCKKSEFFILITNYTTILSPLTCGRCFKSVPLYKLPIYYDYGYLPILRWETDYQSCDNLQMNCTVGEPWALGQMQSLTSLLSKQGLEICNKLTELTSIPTYYYIHNYSKVKGDQSAMPCPGCSKKWHLKKQLHEFYDFKCDTCKLVSTFSPNY